MLKVSINNLSQPTDVYVWIYNSGGNSKLNLLLTFHATEADAIADKQKKTDKYLQSATMIPPTFAIDMPTVYATPDVAGLTLAVDQSTKAYIETLGLSNITSITIV